MTEADPAQTLLTLTTGYWVSRCLHVAAELGVSDVLGDEPQAAEALAGAFGVQADPLGRVLRCLANHGVFAMTGERFIHNGPRGCCERRPAVPARPGRMMGLKMHWDAYGELEQAVRTGEPGSTRRPGGPVRPLRAIPRRAASSTRP